MVSLPFNLLFAGLSRGFSKWFDNLFFIFFYFYALHILVSFRKPFLPSTWCCSGQLLHIPISTQAWPSLSRCSLFFFSGHCWLIIPSARLMWCLDGFFHAPFFLLISQCNLLSVWYSLRSIIEFTFWFPTIVWFDLFHGAFIFLLLGLFYSF
jgi:hypothetical protein